MIELSGFSPSFTSALCEHIASTRRVAMDDVTTHAALDLLGRFAVTIPDWADIERFEHTVLRIIEVTMRAGIEPEDADDVALVKFGSAL